MVRPREQDLTARKRVGSRKNRPWQLSETPRQRVEGCPQDEGVEVDSRLGASRARDRAWRGEHCEKKAVGAGQRDVGKSAKKFARERQLR